ncbi:hypothetical protein Pla52o_32720 [Novipirellula galeiformis]|uniref:Cbb3-type cytochrome oxidase component FixQ n=1 Tax=Novipirellula galeiformis TaxID=2528004 RepID=A0A5C6CEP0_9BACT|nr:hypothetical protein [Novipirellula galeiformis]TWU22217.1 hypothetical protein Pla52o_32720 [Novipirellula galeiformis]
MLTDVIRAIDYSDCAEIALMLFCFAFGLMFLATMRLSRNATERFAAIPLSDNVETPRDGQ